VIEYALAEAQAAQPQAAAPSLRQLALQQLAESAREAPKSMARAVAARLRGAPPQHEKFYGFDAGDLQRRLATVQSILQREVRLTRISSGLAVLEAP